MQLKTDLSFAAFPQSLILSVCPILHLFSMSLLPRLLIPTNWTAQGALIVISFAKSDGDGLYMVIESFSENIKP